MLQNSELNNQKICEMVLNHPLLQIGQNKRWYKFDCLLVLVMKSFIFFLQCFFACLLCKHTFDLLFPLPLTWSGTEKEHQSQVCGVLRGAGLCAVGRKQLQNSVWGYLEKDLFCLLFSSLKHILPLTFTGENRILGENIAGFPSFH